MKLIIFSLAISFQLSAQNGVSFSFNALNTETVELTIFEFCYDHEEEGVTHYLLEIDTVVKRKKVGQKKFIIDLPVNGLYKVELRNPVTDCVKSAFIETGDKPVTIPLLFNAEFLNDSCIDIRYDKAKLVYVYWVFDPNLEIN